MERIIRFKTLKDLKDHINSLNFLPIGSGAEGNVYVTLLMEAIKSCDTPYIYEPGKYIMENDINVSSFIFPRELFICKNDIYGYRMAYFHGNVFKEKINLCNIDLDKVLEARKKLINDALIMTDRGYKLIDLPGNLLFDNKVFKAIDTLSYIKQDDHTGLKDINLSLVDKAILHGLNPEEDYRILIGDVNFDEHFEKIKKMKRDIYG